MGELSTFLWQKQKSSMESLLERSGPMLMTVATVGASTLTVTDPRTNSLDGAPIPWMGPKPAIGEEVLVFWLSGGARVALRAELMTGLPLLVGEAIEIDQLPDFLTVGVQAQSSADTSSTTSTVTYAQGQVLSLTLPVGTWNVKAVGGLLLRNTGGNANYLVSIDGDNGTQRTLSLATEMMVVDDHELGGIAGNRSINIGVWYKSSAAGTSSARGPWAMAVARRTA